MVYTIPVHTYRNAQQLDVIPYAVLTTEINRFAKLVMEEGEGQDYTTFSFCSLLRDAFTVSMTEKNITYRFSRAGVWPLDALCVIFVPIPVSPREPIRILSSYELDELLETKLHEHRESVV